MKLNFWYLAALLPLALVLSKGAFGAQFAVIGITLGIFFGLVVGKTVGVSSFAWLAAKTGTLNDVTALSGWVTTDSGTPLAFSTVQNPAGRRIQAGDLALPGQLLQALLSYPQAPPAEQLSPLPPNPT